MVATLKSAVGRLVCIGLLACSGTMTGQNASSQPEVSASSPTAITVSVNVLADRHAISPYVYGVNFPSDTTYIKNSGAAFVRWGGNASSRYNWKTFNTSSAADWFFQNRTMGDTAMYQDSKVFISDVVGTGAAPIITIPMLGWVAKDATSYSYSVATYGTQCKVNPYNSDDGNGLKTDCSTNLAGANPNATSVPFLDSPGVGDPAGSVYLSEWIAAIKPLFGTTHFYDMDNEMDIWSTAPTGGTHHDIHPAASGYDEMRDVYLQHARAIGSFDTRAVRFGPVSCCWWFYFNGANNNDKGTHAGVDFMPWWLNEVYWSDQNLGKRSLEVFDFHAYPDSPDYSGYTQAQKQALATRITRDYWDPTYVSESGSINQPWVTQLQPNRTIPFRIPRIRAIVNSIYPYTKVSITEWNQAFAGESDFSTALADADTYGIMGREHVYAAARWTAADAANPAFQALRIYRNYDGLNHTFGVTSVSTNNNGDPNLFSSYGALNSLNNLMTLMLVNKDPVSSVTTTLAPAGFTPTWIYNYQLASTNPGTIKLISSVKWTPTVTLPPYSVTLLVIRGTMTAPSAEWDLNPDTTAVPAGGSVLLQPFIASGSGSVTMNSVSSDAGVTITNSTPNITTAAKGLLIVKAGNTPGFYHFSVNGTDNTGVAQTKTGWILVGNPSASLTKTGDGQKAAKGTNINLSVTLNPGASGGTAGGARIRFTASAGVLSSRIVSTNGAGVATVTLTLPGTAGTVSVRAEGQYALGRPVVTFTETAQ